MKLSELIVGQQIVIQILWGEQKIEFFSKVLEVSDMSVLVTPYLHNDSPLELNIDAANNVICNIFVTSQQNNQRRSWRNVELQTIKEDGKVSYCITTNGFNHVSSHDDRRKHERVSVYKDAQICDTNTGERTDILINDISDIGISFTAKEAISVQMNQIVILFQDVANDKNFNMRVECKVVRKHNTDDGVFYGCRIINENKDFLLYSFILRLMNNRKYKTGMIDDISNS